MNEFLKEIKLFVLDLDGTVYLGDRLLPGSLPFFKKAKETGRRVLFFTNNSSKTAENYVEKLTKMGVELTRKDILTSGDVAIGFLKEHYPGKSVFLMGTEALRADFAARGISLFGANIAKKMTPDIVLAAFDTELTYAKLERACTYIREGAIFLATHPDINCPTDGGFIPDCGAFCAAISLSTGIEPRILGKPYPEVLELLVRETGFAKNEICFVGDRLYTDVAAGTNNGAHGILVLSGETKAADIAASPIKPNAVFSDLAALADTL